MPLADEILKRLKGKRVVVVTSLESDGYLQEMDGLLVDGGEGYVVVQQGDGDSPTIVNTAFVAWVYEETEE